MKEVEKIEVERIISFLEDDKNYFFKMSENPKYSDADRRKADDLYLDVKEAIKIIRKLESKLDEVCEWIKYDYRTICPKEHNIYNPYWRIPEDRMDTLKYCPYCGRKIKVVK